MASVFAFALFFVLIGAGPARADYLDDWFNKIVENLNGQIVNYGVANLKVDDLKLLVNRTLVPGLHLEGDVSYLNGVVADLEELFFIVDGYRGGVDQNGAQLFYQIDFPNMTIFTDVEANMKEQGSGKGTAELFFGNSTVGFYFNFDYNTGEQIIRCESHATSPPATNFLPDTELLRAVARLARLELGYRMLWDQLQSWCDNVLKGMLRKAIDEIEFPIVPPIKDQFFSD